MSKLYIVYDNILYKKSSLYDKICIPFNILQQLCQHIHDSKGHLSAEKLSDFFNLYYYSDKIRKYAKLTVDQCFICQTLHTPPAVKKAPGNQRLFQPKRPREGWSFDLITDLPKSSENFTTMLLATDIFSKYVVCYFLEGKTQKRVAAAVFSHISNFGVPKFIISDSDNSLISVFQPLAEKFGFFFSSSPPFSQHLNYVERSYKEIKKMVKKYVYDPKTETNSRNEWPLCIILVINAINALPLRNLEYSREQIMFRFESNTKIFFDPQLNENLSHLDRQILDNVQAYLTAHKNSQHPDYKKLFTGQIIYIKDGVNPIPGEHSAFKWFHRGPLKITSVNNDRRTAIAYCPDSKKYYTSHFKDIITIKNPNSILPIFSKSWDHELEIKRASPHQPKLYSKFPHLKAPD